MVKTHTVAVLAWKQLGQNPTPRFDLEPAHLHGRAINRASRVAFNRRVGQFNQAITKRFKSDLHGRFVQLTKAVVLAACDPTKDRCCAGHIWVAAYRTNGFTVCDSLANLCGECFGEDGWATVGFLSLCHSTIIEIARLIWVPSRLYGRVKVTDRDTQFQILIHARTRFAHPTVVNSHSSICCICRMSCIFHFESYFYYMSCDHTPLLRIHIF